MPDTTKLSCKCIHRKTADVNVAVSQTCASSVLTAGDSSVWFSAQGANAGTDPLATFSVTVGMFGLSSWQSRNVQEHQEQQLFTGNSGKAPCFPPLSWRWPCGLFFLFPVCSGSFPGLFPHWASALFNILSGREEKHALRNTNGCPSSEHPRLAGSHPPSPNLLRGFKQSPCTHPMFKAFSENRWIPLATNLLEEPVKGWLHALQSSRESK